MLLALWNMLDMSCGMEDGHTDEMVETAFSRWLLPAEGGLDHDQFKEVRQGSAVQCRAVSSSTRN